MATDYALLFIEGERAGQAFALTKDEVTLGRSRANDLTFNDQLLSRQHLVFRREGGEIMVEDLGSTHGAFLNEKRLRGILSLNEGDVIQTGDQKMRLVKLSEVADLVGEPGAAPEAVDRGAAAAEAEAADELDKTRFGDVEDGEETRYHAVEDVRYDEEDDDRTRVLQDQATRMLDMNELQGLKAAAPPKSAGKRVALGVVLFVFLLGVAGFFVYRQIAAGNQSSAERLTYTDEQYAFRLKYPGTWLKSTTIPDALIGFQLMEDRQPAAHLKVYVDRDGDHALEGLTYGFARHVNEVLEDRYPNFRLKGQMLLDINRVRVIQYGFRAGSTEGLGIFTINGVDRFDVEAATTPERYDALKNEFVELLGTFSLDKEQEYIDYPLPDEETRRLALADPEALTEAARAQMELARDLLARRQVRQENLFRAVEQYQGAMQKCTALLAHRPPFYEQTAAGLGEATRLLAESVDDVMFQITMAEKTRDFETLRWGVAQLMQMVPDKNDPVYRFAREKMKRYRL